MSMLRVCMLIAACLAVRLAGADAPFTAVAMPSVDDAPPPALALGPGDSLDIEIMGEVNTLQTCIVGLDGMLYYGGYPGLAVGGATIANVAERLTTEVAKHIRNPRLSIGIRAIVSRSATILGRVNAPGMVSLRGDERVLDLLSSAGFLSTSRMGGSTEELADLSGALFIRQGRVLALDFTALLDRGDQRYNIRVHPGDLCIIPSALSREICVFGAVQEARPIGFKNGLTALQALAAAKGPLPDAWLNKTIVLRGSATNPLVARVDLRSALSGNGGDILLMPKDIVYVPGPQHDSPEKLARVASDAFSGAYGGLLGAQVWQQISK